MSKAVQLRVLLLIVLLVVSIAVALVTLLEKQKLQDQTKSLNQQIEEAQSKQAQLVAESNQLKERVSTLTDQLAAKDKDRSKYQSQYDELKSRYDKISEDVDQLSMERDDWKSRVSTISQERDQLMKELQDRPEKIVEKIVYKEPEPALESVNQIDSSGDDFYDDDSTMDATAVVREAQENAAREKKDENHWAEIIKQKAALELELEGVRKELDKGAIQIVELKKQAADFQLEIDHLKSEREEILRKIKHGEDMVDNLSVELARSKNDQKFLAGRAEKLNADNTAMLAQIKQLSNTRLSLEKTISRLTEDKATIQKKLIESESVIQGRIDDIWKIKQNIDSRFANLPQNIANQNSNQIELAPIVVNANVNGQATELSASTNRQATTSQPEQAKSQGHIVSINSDNNFVIIDIGEKDGVKIGNAYRVYRGAKEIARLEVIQVRRDIAAADIKKKSTAIQVGDNVR